MERKELRPHNSRGYLRQLIHISFVSISIPLILFSWSYLEHSAGNLTSKVEEGIIPLIFLITSGLMIACVYTGHRLIMRRLLNISPENTLVEKLSQYKQVILLRFSSFALATIIIATGFMITASEMMAILFAIMVVLYSIYNPSLHGIVRELALKGEEKEKILKNLPFGIEE